MWEAIKDILTSKNTIPILIFLAIVLVIISYCIKNKYIRFNTNNLSIGIDEKERAIIRQQIEWSNQFINGLYGTIIDKYPSLDKIMAKYILELVYDEVVNWISFNHITNSEMYISIKQDKVCSIVYSMDVDDCIRSNEFKDIMKSWVKIIIDRLVDIRRFYTKKNNYD